MVNPTIEEVSLEIKEKYRKIKELKEEIDTLNLEKLYINQIKEDIEGKERHQRALFRTILEKQKWRADKNGKRNR